MILCNLKWQLLTVVEEPFGGGGGVGQSRWVFIICRLHLISYLMLLLLLEALEGEREQQRQRQPPTSLLLVPAPKMPEVVPAARISITQLGLGRHTQRHRATVPRVAAPSPILPPKTAGVLASGSRRQEAEFVLVEASVRSGSGSRSELTPEVRGFPPGASSSPDG